MPSNPNLPVPEIVDDLPEDPYSNPWRVYEDTMARASFATKEMYTPAGDTVKDRLTRAHELMHKISPPEGPEAAAKRYKVTDWSVALAEDVRVNSRIAYLGNELGELAREHGFLSEEEISQTRERIIEAQKNGDLEGAAKMIVLVAAYETSAFRDITSIHERERWDKFVGPDIANYIFYREACTIAKEVTRNSKSIFKHTIKAAKGFDKILSIKREEQKEKQKEILKNKQKSKQVQEQGKANITNEEGEEKKIQAEMEREPPELNGTGNSRERWGKFNIKNYAHEKPAKIRNLGVGRRFAKLGTRIGQLHRIITDQRIFVARQEKKGGTVLIDASGSMSWNMKDLWDLTLAAPHAKVAIYAGDRYKGQISIIVNSGKSISQETLDIEHDKMHISKYNTIDGPALRWLARQDGPRVWISDGGVNGSAYGNASYTDLRKECDNIVVRAGIVMVINSEEALEFFRKRYRVKR
jgi:hypothetical protein